MTGRYPARRLSSVAAIAAALFALDAYAADPCRPARLEHAGQVVANEQLDLELPDGRVIRLAGVESPPSRGANPRFMQSAVEDLELWTSALISVAILKPQPDRWGRLEGRAFLLEKANAPDMLPSLSEAVIDAGLARVDPSTESRPCLDRLYLAESRARSMKRGLWADPANGVFEAERPNEFKGKPGSVTIVEGRVASVREGRSMTFVNLGDGSPKSPALTIGREALRAMEREGMKPGNLAGRTIRARGILDLRAGPRIEIVGPGAVEVLPISTAGR